MESLAFRARDEHDLAEIGKLLDMEKAGRFGSLDAALAARGGLSSGEHPVFSDSSADDAVDVEAPLMQGTSQEGSRASTGTSMNKYEGPQQSQKPAPYQKPDVRGGESNKKGGLPVVE